MRQFVVVAEVLNFHHAAARLKMTQPPLSAAMQRLEERVGARLLERNRQRVKLTPAGVVFLAEARRTIAQSELAIELARASALGITGVLRIASVPSAAFDFLPDILPRFRAEHPEVRIVLTCGTTEQELASLRQGLIDLAIVVTPMTKQKGLDITPLMEERFLLAVPVSHPLAASGTVKLSAFAEDPLVSFSFAESPGYAAAIVSACQGAGFFPRILQETSQMPTSLTLVAAGMGVALIPRPMSRVAMKGVAYLDVVSDEGNPLPYSLAFATRYGNNNPTIDSFLRHALSK